MDYNNIKRVMLKYKELVPEKIFKRDLIIFKARFDKANVIVGPRRSGKTFYLYELIKNNKEKSTVLINFEDNLLNELTQNDLNKVLEYSKELFNNELVFFFDEIQSVEDWEKFIISLLNEHYGVYVTGSNSKLLSKEIASSLRGKSLPYLLLPFSFVEFLRVKGMELKKNFEYTDKAIEIKRYFSDFMKYGGFPEVVFSDELALKNKLINNYFDSVLYKDLVERLNLKNMKLVEITMKYHLNLFANTFSISSYENYLKSNKVPYSLEDLYVILKSLQDVFLVSYVKEYTKSFKKAEFSKAKVYLFDTGYIHFLSYEPEDHGRIMENLVFIELFRREENIENKSIFYYKSKEGKECDFIVTKKNKVNEAIQVTYELNQNNRQREIDGILGAMEFFKLKNGLILTFDQEEDIVADKRKIKVKPVWKWLLGK